MKKKLNFAKNIFIEYIQPNLGKSLMIAGMAATVITILMFSLNELNILLHPSINSPETKSADITLAETKYVLKDPEFKDESDDSRVKYVSETQKSNQLEDIIDSLNELTQEE